MTCAQYPDTAARFQQRLGGGMRTSRRRVGGVSELHDGYHGRSLLVPTSSYVRVCPHIH